MTIPFNPLRDKADFADSLSPGYSVNPKQFVSGSGSKLIDHNGRDYIDLCSGTATNSVGHAHPKLVQAMKESLELPWNINDYSSPHRTSAVQRLRDLSPNVLECFHFYSGGSETVEAALRALRSSMGNVRNGILTFKGSYFGKTLGARQLIDWKVSGEMASSVFFVNFPDAHNLAKFDCKEELEANCLKDIEFNLRHKKIGAIVAEPVLGSGGSLYASYEFWGKLRKLVDDYEILLYFDEIYCGFGRGGSDLYFQSLPITPDIVSFAKGIGGGFPTIALSGRKDLMEKKPFGTRGSSCTTFGGNPLAMCAIDTTLGIYKEERLLDNVVRLAPKLSNALEELANNHLSIIGYKSVGFMGALKLSDAETNIRLHKACIDSGLFLATFDSVCRIAPALNISENELDEGLARLRIALDLL